MEIGLVGLAVSMVLIGPVSFVLDWFGWSHQRLWLLYVSAILAGTFVGASLMPTFNEMLRGAS